MSRPYADVSWIDIASIFLPLFQLPFLLLWTAFKHLVTVYAHSTRRGRRKTWRRSLGDTAFRFLTERWSIQQLQFALGTSKHVYEKWAKQNGLPAYVEPVGEDARLLWIGPRQTKRVVLYFHGGGYLLPLSDFAVSFWNHARKECKRDGMDVGFAILNYSLVPTARFPKQLTQAVAALQHVITKLKVHPGNIQITGDSAGANLALALLSHLMHPLDGIPQLTLPSPLKGVYFMSPWFCLTADRASLANKDATDVVGVETYLDCARKVLAGGVPRSVYPYLVATTAPDSWFAGIDRVVERILVTTGGAECLRDETLKVAERIRKHHDGTTIVVQEGGVHNDPFFDFLAGERELCTLAPVIVEWVSEGFAKEG